LGFLLAPFLHLKKEDRKEKESGFSRELYVHISLLLSIFVAVISIVIFKVTVLLEIDGFFMMYVLIGILGLTVLINFVLMIIRLLNAQRSLLYLLIPLLFLVIASLRYILSLYTRDLLALIFSAHLQEVAMVILQVFILWLFLVKKCECKGC